MPRRARRLTSRKFLMTLAAQVAGLFVLFFPEFESQITAAASHIAALLAMSLSAAGYAWAESRVDVERERSAGETRRIEAEQRARERRKAADPPGERPREQPGGAGRSGLLLVLLVALAGVAGAAGCASGPVDRWHHLRADLSDAQDAVRGQWEAGHLSNREIVNLDGYARGVRESLALARPLLPGEGEEPAGSGERLKYWLDTAERVLDRLIEAETLPPSGESDDGRTAAPADRGARVPHHRPGPLSLRRADVRPPGAARRADPRAALRHPRGRPAVRPEVG